MRDREPNVWASARRLANAAARVGRLDLALRFYENAHALGWRALHPRVGISSADPIPPARLRVRSGPRHLDPNFFLASGRRHADLIRRILTDDGTSIESLDALLDFGCGSGRVIRHWSNLQDKEIDGCDLNPDAVAWCSLHLPFARFEVNRLTPPLPYADRSFDLVYAFSVFTHLPQDLQLAWMRECGRILQPGGYFLISTLGAYFVGKGRLSRREREAFESGEVVVLYEGVPGSNLCSAYHPRTYVEQVLARDFEVVRLLPEADDGHHDLYLLRKPSGPSP
jgi:SAM-dependent methyltransferase